MSVSASCRCGFSSWRLLLNRGRLFNRRHSLFLGLPAGLADSGKLALQGGLNGAWLEGCENAVLLVAQDQERHLAQIRRGQQVIQVLGHVAGLALERLAVNHEHHAQRPWRKVAQHVQLNVQVSSFFNFMFYYFSFSIFGALSLLLLFVRARGVE